MAGISSKAALISENYKKYNGIEFDKDLDINVYEAFYRTLDPQNGRWWQIDPKCENNINPDFDDEDETIVEGLESMSPYISMGDNPVKHTDPDGDIFGLDNLVGAVVGAVVEYGSQVAENLASGKSLKQSLTQVNGKSIAGAAVVGFITDGVANIAGKAISRVGGKIVANIASKTEKVIEAEKKLASIEKLEQRVQKLSKIDRSGKDFTNAGKETVKDLNKAKNSGKMVCEACGQEASNASKSTKGVKPPGNEAQVDHIVPKAKGGSGTPDNGQLLCRDCNIKKGAN